ncbi:MAG: NAD(P)/FAD-dependent oxidoreductase [Chthoniobacteraceae bacterium]|jgi:flavin-dependent dehydrogenase
MLYDAIIIGGGPGGSTAGSALARAGKRVLILERERFPRFHVGESLIPFGNDIFNAIGVWEKIQQAGFMPKLGAEFVLGNSKAAISIVFDRYLARRYAHTFQVERSRFDQLMLDHAAASGCEVWQEARVKSASVSADGATVACVRDGQTHELKARWLCDASGRDAFLGKQLQLPKSDLGMPKKFATFAHFRGVRRNDPPAHGHITVVRLDFGWFWMIPLSAEKTSVGLVQALDHFRSTGMQPGEYFEHVISTSTELRRRMEGAERVCDFCFASDYTYRHLQNAGPRWFLIGDAAGFIDPIFSSGVMLAVKSGYLAAQAALAADTAGAPLAAAAQARYTREVGGMCHVFLRLIKMFYDNRSFEVFMTPRPHKGMEWAVHNAVAGNTDAPWLLTLRLWAFYGICALQRRLPIVPRLDFAEPTV